jgi:hypothetical protein
LLGRDAIAGHFEFDRRGVGEGVAVESNAADAADERGENRLASRETTNRGGPRLGDNAQPSSSKRRAGTSPLLFLRGSGDGRFGQAQAATTAESRSSRNFGIAASGLRWAGEG